MKLEIKVKANAGRNEVFRTDEGVFLIKVSAPPEKGKANEMALKLLSEFLRVPRSRLSISRGHASSRKLVTVD